MRQHKFYAQFVAGAKKNKNETLSVAPLILATSMQEAVIVHWKG